MTKNPDAIIFLVGLVLLAISVARFTYLAWYEPEKLRSISTKSIEHLPKWWPLRNYFASYYKQSRAYIWFTRIVLIVAAVTLLLLIILTLSMFLEK